MKYLYAYRCIAVPSVAITLVCCYVVITAVSGIDLSLVVWTKLISSSILVLYIHLFQQQILYFFMNLGISRNIFYASAFGVDFLIFIILISLSLLFK